MKPSNKSPEMTKTIDSLSKALFGRSRTESIEGGKCVTCGGEVTGFRDELSRREYRISGMCQLCQDSIFR